MWKLMCEPKHANISKQLDIIARWNYNGKWWLGPYFIPIGSCDLWLLPCRLNTWIYSHMLIWFGCLLNWTETTLVLLSNMLIFLGSITLTACTNCKRLHVSLNRDNHPFRLIELVHSPINSILINLLISMFLKVILFMWCSSSYESYTIKEINCIQLGKHRSSFVLTYRIVK